MSPTTRLTPSLAGQLLQVHRVDDNGIQLLDKCVEYSRITPHTQDCGMLWLSKRLQVRDIQSLLL